MALQPSEVGKSRDPQVGLLSSFRRMPSRWENASTPPLSILPNAVELEDYIDQYLANQEKKDAHHVPIPVGTELRAEIFQRVSSKYKEAGWELVLLNGAPQTGQNIGMHLPFNGTLTGKPDFTSARL